MNKPDDEVFDTDEDGPKVTEISLQKITSAAKFIINKEDHTIGNLLAHQLQLDEDVIFTGYRVPHPLEHKVELQIQTNEDATPKEAFTNAIQELQNELADLSKQFSAGVEKIKIENDEHDEHEL